MGRNWKTLGTKCQNKCFKIPFLNYYPRGRRDVGRRGNGLKSNLFEPVLEIRI
jgi:hypothetical protein